MDNPCHHFILEQSDLTGGRGWLAREFLQALSGVKRLAWPHASWGKGRGSAVRTRSETERRRKKAHRGSAIGKPSLPCFEAESRRGESKAWKSWRLYLFLQRQTRTVKEFNQLRTSESYRWANSSFAWECVFSGRRSGDGMGELAAMQSASPKIKAASAQSPPAIRTSVNIELCQETIFNKAQHCYNCLCKRFLKLSSIHFNTRVNHLFCAFLRWVMPGAQDRILRLGCQG